MATRWHRVDGELDEGRVRTVVINGRTIAVHRADELDEATKALFAADGPALLHVHVDAELV